MVRAVLCRECARKWVVNPFNLWHLFEETGDQDIWGYMMANSFILVPLFFHSMRNGATVGINASGYRDLRIRAHLSLK